MPVMRREEPRPEPPEPERIEELFAALEAPLLSYAWRLTGGRPAAEDIVQEAFMRLHEHYEEVREPRRWLYRTVHNLALNHQRSAGRVVPLVLEATEESPTATPEGADPQPLPDEQIARMEGIGLVRLGMAALDARSRELVRLKFNEELSYKEIGQKMGLTAGHVGYLLHHALKTLADELSRNGAA